MTSRRLRTATVGAVAALCAASLACGAGSGGELPTAIAVLSPTPQHLANGEVRLEALGEGGVRVVAELDGLSSGLHAFHVHRVGDCSEEAEAAGPHYEFEPVEEGEAERVTGNLGELDANDSGEARLETTVEQAELDGPRSIIGRSIVVHARGNDPNAPPDGDAGARIACGVIEANHATR